MCHNYMATTYAFPQCKDSIHIVQMCFLFCQSIDFCYASKKPVFKQYVCPALQTLVLYALFMSYWKKKTPICDLTLAGNRSIAGNSLWFIM